ncbi:MAG: hypothetical protein MUO87_06380, partial [Thermoplasmata archaeon]|nr:hypothetical protein [Thermoplasmata archaeon]
MLSVTLLAVSIFADTRARADRGDAARIKNVDQFNLQSPRAPHSTFSEEEADAGSANLPSSSNQRPYRPLGSALSPDVGIGVGESIALTWDDTQVFYPVGRHIDHFYNESTGDVDVHFCYEMARDTTTRRQETLPLRQTGYNVYNATVEDGDWPQGGQDVGCTIQGADTIGFGRGGNMVITPNGLAVFVAYSSFYSPEVPGTGFVRENKLFYQLAQYNCVYNLGTENVTSVDSLSYKPLWSQPDLAGNLSAFPIIATQIDGSGTLITHLVLAEQQAFTPADGLGYATNVDYRVFVHFRKVGDDISSGWNSGIVIDTIERDFADLVASPWTGEVAVIYSNPSYSGHLLNNGSDRDTYYRESTDYGVSWNPKVDITNYRNDLEGVPHFTQYFEVRGLYSSDGNLHILHQQRPAS